MTTTTTPTEAPTTEPTATTPPETSTTVPPTSTTAQPTTTVTFPPTMTTTPPVPDTDLAITASLDRTSYVEGQSVDVTVRIVNNSDVDATGVRVVESGRLYTAGQWNDLGDGRAVIAARATREIAVVGTFDAGSTSFWLTLEVTSETGEATPENNTITLRADVVRAMARFGGTVFEDRDGDGALDQGEGVYGTNVSAWGGNPYTYQSVYTGFDGRFAFSDLPEGEYTVQYDNYNYTLYGVGGAEGRETLTLVGDQYADVRIRAQPALRTVLNAKVLFDGTRYSVGDTVTGKVLLTNSGARDLAGVTASCHGLGWQLEVDLGALAGGVMVPSGATIAVPISATVPAGADREGRTALSCTFAAAGYSASGSPSLYATVAVNGLPASGTGTLLATTTYNPVPDMPVDLLDQETGRSVARAVSRADGSFSFVDVPAGRYDVRVDGPWRAYQWFDVRVGSEWPNTVYLVPDVANQGRVANLKAAVALDKTAYESHELVRATLTISNIGNADATGVRLSTESGSNYHPDSGWGELSQGVTIAAGATRTFEYAGSPLVWPSMPNTVVFSGRLWSQDAELNFDNNEFFAMASWTVVRGDYSGVVYADKNGNGRPDRGEGMDGVRVQASGGRPYSGREVITDSDGRFTMPQIVTGDYVTYIYANDEDWVVVGPNGDGMDRFTLTRAGRTVEMRAVPALRRTLKAGLAVEKDTYGKGDVAKARVTLTNKGTVALAGINAECGAHEGWLDTTEGWHPIGESDPGADLAPGETKTFDVVNKISDEDYRVGYHEVWCTFVADGHLSIGAPQASDSAVVVGAVGTRTGEVVHDANRDWNFTDDERLAGVTVQLVDLGTGKAVAETVTDGSGRFTFADRAAGRYRIHVVGPWTFQYDDPWSNQFPIWEGTADYVPTFLMIPGPDQPPVGS